MILETERLILRPWQDSDAEILYRYASCPEVGPIAGWPVHTSVENSLEIIRGVLSEPETYAVVPKAAGHIAGSIGLMIGKASNLDLPDTEGEVGYWIGVPFWGQGLIPEAVKEILRYGFEDLKLEKIWCGYFDGNIKSKRVQEKCGFIYHHTNENVYWNIMKDYRTNHVSCLTRREWLRNQIRNQIQIVRLIDRPELKEVMAEWFHDKWGIPLEAYRESMAECLAGESAVPQWYAAMIDDRIAGGLGVIENDFHDRKDLAPNVCAVYVEEEYRCLGIAGQLLNYVCRDMKQYGIETLYLVTDHTSFYERYGWEFLCMVQGDGEPEQSRMYVHR